MTSEKSPAIDAGLKDLSFTKSRGAVAASRIALLVGGIANSLLLPLVLERSAVGLFFQAQVAIAALSTIAQLGFTFTVPQFLSAYVAENKFAEARFFIASIITVSILTSALLTGLCSIFLYYGDLGPAEHTILTCVFFTAAFNAQSAISCEILRALRSYGAANIIMTSSGLFVPIYVSIVYFGLEHSSIQKVLYCGLVGSTGVFMLSILLVYQKVIRFPKKAFHKKRIVTFTAKSLPNLLSSLVLFLMSQADIILLSHWYGAQEVAVYGIATRISALLLFPLAIANSALAPVAVEHRVAERNGELCDLVSSTARTSALLAGAGYSAFLLIGYPLIDFWNPAFIEAYYIFAILGFGQVIHAACGAAGVLLMTGGQQLTAMRITLGAGFLTIILGVLGLEYLGVGGLAAAMAAGNILQMLAFAYRARLHFGIDPTVLGLHRPMRGAARVFSP